MTNLLRRVAVDVRPLRHGAFRRLWLGQSVSVVGFQLTGVAVAVEMFAITSSSLWVGLIGVAALVPLVVFGLYGGAVSDAVDRRRLLVASSYLTWLSTFGLLAQALLGLEQRWVLLGLVALQSVGFAFTSPTRGAVVPRIVPRDLVPSANTLVSTALGVGAVVGPLLAGVVLARGSYALAYGIDAALFTAALYAAHRLPPILPLGEVTRPGLRSVVAGLAFIRRHPVLMMSFAVDIAAMVLAMPRALFPEVAEERFGGPAAAGWLFAAIAIGSVVGGLLSGWIGRVRRQGAALVAAVVVWGLAVAAAGLAGDLWLVVALLAVGGAADLVSAVYRQTILQTYAPDEMRGRMQGVFIVVVAGGPRLGDLRAGASAAAFGVTWSWVGGGIACVVVVLALAAAVPALVRYRAGDGPVAEDDENSVEGAVEPR
ncbi:MAG TPA: MFS transporter [Actinomycetes bacterium]|nr:MFS transporter [Actinomycetes bacterium]